MKKEDVIGLIIFVIAFGAGLVVAFTVLTEFNVTFMSRFWFTMLTVILAFVLNAIGLEVSHVIGGIIGGYEIISINILGLEIEKIGGKKKFHYRDYNGLTGETKLSPKKDKTNLKPFVWAPIVAYLVEVVVGAIIIMLVKEENAVSETPEWLALGSVLFITVSSMIALYNLIPLRLNSLNDGYRLRLLSNPQSEEALNELFRVENELRNGKQVLNIKKFENVNDFTATPNLFYLYNKLAKNELDDALELINVMLEKKETLGTDTLYRILGQKMYVLILTNIEEAREFYDAEVKDNIRKFIANDIFAESLRAYVLIAGLIDKSESEVMLVKKRFARVNEQSLLGRKADEQRLFDEAIEKIYKEHPEWDKKESIAA